MQGSSLCRNPYRQFQINQIIWQNDPLLAEIKQCLSEQQLGRLIYLINARQRDQAFELYRDITGKDAASVEEDIDILTEYYSVNLSSNSLLPLYVIGALIIIGIILKVFF